MQNYEETKKKIEELLDGMSYMSIKILLKNISDTVELKSKFNPNQKES